MTWTTYNILETSLYTAVDYHSIKTTKIKTCKTQQFVSPVNGIIRRESNSNRLLYSWNTNYFWIRFPFMGDPIYGWNRMMGFIGF